MTHLVETIISMATFDILHAKYCMLPCVSTCVEIIERYHTLIIFMDT